MNEQAEAQPAVPDQQEAKPYEVKVTGPGVGITRPIDEATMSRVIALLFGATDPAPARNEGGAGALGGGGHQDQSAQRGGQQQWEEELTLSEFIDDIEAKTFQHKICATGYYLMRQGADTFSRDDVKTALDNAHEDMPANFTRDFNETAAKSLIARKTGETDRYIIPRTGKVAVESHFQDLPKRRTSRRAPRRSASAANGATE